jgi:hypothetical protein
VNILTDKISRITKLLLNFNNTDASAKKIIVTVVHWFEPGCELGHLLVPNDSTWQLKVSAYSATTPLTVLYMLYTALQCYIFQNPQHKISSIILFKMHYREPRNHLGIFICFLML